MATHARISAPVAAPKLSEELRGYTPKIKHIGT